MEVSPAGIVTSVKLLQLANAELPMEINSFGKTIAVREVLPVDVDDL
jgi:hypothetical protein